MEVSGANLISVGIDNTSIIPGSITNVPSQVIVGIFKHLSSIELRILH